MAGIAGALAGAIPVVGPIASLASSIFGGIMTGNRNRRVGEQIANVNEGTANDVLAATGRGMGGVAQAGNQAIQNVGNATTSANETLQGGLDKITGQLDPYLQAGAKGVNALSEFATTAPKFTYQDYANDPAFAFQMDQGKQAIQNSAAAQGLASGGNVLKDLTKYGQGLASTYYNDAFDRYMRQRDSQLQGLTALTGAGQTATGQYSGAVQNTTGQQSQNTVNNGRYAGDTGMDVAQFLANLDLQGTKTAGDYRIQGAQARGAGLLGQTNALTTMGNQLAQVIPQIAGARRPSSGGGSNNPLIINNAAGII